MTATFAGLDLSLYNTERAPEYFSNFERWFAPFIGRPARILELGIQGGGSLELWRDAFPGGVVVGLDLNPSPVPTSEQIRTYQGFQQDPRLLDLIAAECAPDGFDIIIDDASHMGEYTLASFWHLFPRHLKTSGLYVLDDWSCAYLPSWPDGARYKGDAPLGLTDAPPPASNTRYRLEGVRRRARSAARPIAARLEVTPGLRSVLERGYLEIEGRLAKCRFPSHDFGMVGVVKQLVDATAAEVIWSTTASDGDRPDRVIDRMEIAPSQVLLVKH